MEGLKQLRELALADSRRRHPALPDQKEYERQVIQAGGLYWIIRNFTEFTNHYNHFKF